MDKTIENHFYVIFNFLNVKFYKKTKKYYARIVFFFIFEKF